MSNTFRCGRGHSWEPVTNGLAAAVQVQWVRSAENNHRVPFIQTVPHPLYAAPPFSRSPTA